MAAFKKGRHRVCPYARRKSVPAHSPSRIAHALRQDAVAASHTPKSTLQNSTPKSADADSPPPAGDRLHCVLSNARTRLLKCPGCADALVGTRLSLVRGGQVTERQQRAAVWWIHSREDRCGASQSLQFGLLCPPKKRTDQKPSQAPRMPVPGLVSPAGGGGRAPRVAGVDCAGRHRGLPLHSGTQPLGVAHIIRMGGHRGPPLQSGPPLPG